MAKQEKIYLIETEDGMLVRVPESRLAAWSQAQSTPKPPKSQAETNRENLVLERVLQKIFGSPE